MRNFAIAGGTRGIGRDIVKQLENDPCEIDVFARQLPEIANSSPPSHSTVRHHSADFTTDEWPLDALPDQLHGAVYCPGTINLRPFRGMKLDEFRNDWEVNFLGAVRFLQACHPALKAAASNEDDAGPSSVVLFSTVAVPIGLPMHASIASAKAAIEGLTRSLAAEWAPHVRVNCVAPALTDTPLATRFFQNDSLREKMAAQYPLKRTGRTADIASAVRYLLSPESGWTTGQVIRVDGGMSTLRV